MAYASASDVANLCRNLLGSSESFNSSTSPTLFAITTWLSSGCGIINATIGSRNFGAIPVDNPAYDVAAETNALYAAWMAERSRTNARVAADERTRADMLKKDFTDHLALLRLFDYASLGMSEERGSDVYAGGISKSDKRMAESDGDRVLPRFARDMFDNPEAMDAGDKGTGESTDYETHPGG